MKPKDIIVGKIYINKGKGRTRRTVLNIGDAYRPLYWNGLPYNDPEEKGIPGVEYRQKDKVDRLSLTSFANWAGAIVEDG